MRIRAVEEVATGIDEVMAAELSRRRRRLGLSLEQAARMTGAEIRELASLESGKLAALGDGERMRLVVYSYCECLHCDPSPFLARLEAYVGHPSGLGAGAGSGRAGSGGAGRPAPLHRFGLLVATAGLGLLFIAGLAILVAAGGN